MTDTPQALPHLSAAGASPPGRGVFRHAGRPEWDRCACGYPPAAMAAAEVTAPGRPDPPARGSLGDERP